jgi:RHS repeat-associated protein
MLSHAVGWAARLFAFVVFSVAAAAPAGAQTLGPNCPFTYKSVCYGTLAEAEAVMRSEPTGSPTGRAYLERDPTWEQVNDATQTTYIYRYRVLGRAGVQKAAWIKPWADAGSYWPVCYCDEVGRPKCFGTGWASTCDTNPDMCTYKYRCPGNTDVVPEILNYMAYQNCPVSIVGTNPGPSGPDHLISAALTMLPPGQTQPENSGFANYYNGNGVGQSITVSRGGAGCAAPRTLTFKYDKSAPIHCPAGLRPSGSNDFSRFCSSNATGEIHAWVIPCDQCEFGNPCIPTTGAKIQPARGMPKFATSIGGVLTYNSMQSTYDNQYLGENWTGVFASQLLFEKYGNGSVIKYQNGQGNYEIFAGAGSGRYRPVNRPGAGILKFSTNANGSCANYTLHEVGRRLVYGCAGAGGAGRLIRIEYPDAPSRDLTVVYAQKDLYDANGTQIAFAGTAQTIREASGREVEFLYGYINQSPDCSTAVSPRACNALRLIAIIDPTNEITNFDYNAYGRIDTIHYPDGSSERFEYGNSVDICPSTIADGCGTPVDPSLPPYLLTGVYRIVPGPNGTTFSTRIGTYQYDNRGRVLVSTHPGDAGKVQVSYSGNGVPTIRQFTDPTHFAMSSIATTRYSMFDKPSIATTSRSSGGGVAYTRAVSYDNRGYLLTKTDARGVRTDLTIDGHGLTTKRVEAANDSSGLTRTTNIGWNPDFRQQTQRAIFDASGKQLNQTMRTLDSDGRVTARCQVDPQNATAMAYVCGSADDAPPGVRQVKFSRCTAVDAAAGTCAFVGQILSVNGARAGSGDSTFYEYYQDSDPLCASSPSSCTYRKGDLKRVVSWIGQGTPSAVQITTDYLAYDGAGRVLAVQDANGVRTDLQYSQRGWLLKAAVRGLQDGIESDDAITRFDYDSRGLVTKLTRPDDSSLTFEYDDADRLIKVKDAYGHYVGFTLDLAGHHTVDETRTSGDVLKRKMSRVFDDLGRLQAIRDAASVSTDFTYAENGDSDTAVYPAASLGATPRVDDVEFDALRRLVSTVTNRDGATSERATTSLAYDPLNRLVGVRDPKGLDTSYQFNPLNDLTRRTSPDTGVTNYAHDAAGNVIQKTDANQVVTSYAYDDLGRLKTIQPGTDAAVNLVFDVPPADCSSSERNGKGRLAQMTDESGSTRYCFDRLGRLVRKVQTVVGGTTPSGGTTLTLGATYDNAGRLAAVTYPSGAIATYLYNANGQINRVDVKPTAAAPQVTLISNVSYLPFGPAGWWIYGNGRAMTRAFDQDYRIDALNDGVAADGLYENYTLDAVGNVKALVERASIARTYDYDGLGRLKAQKNGAATVEGFTYDATGNRLSKTAGATATYAYAADSHRLTSVNGAARTYDAAGNTRTIGTAFEMRYNKRNRLVEIYQGEPASRVLTRTHLYNGKGERVAKWYQAAQSANNTLFIYDESGHLIGEYNALGYRVAEYVWMDDTLVGVLKAHDGSTYQYVEVDYLGTPRAIINPVNNKTVWRWDVTSTAAGSFGDGPASNDPDANGVLYNFNLRYPGQYNDGLAGINYNYFRDYDTTAGRYVESDPIGLKGGMSTYGYVRANAMKFTDPLGLEMQLHAYQQPAMFNEGTVTMYELKPYHLGEKAAEELSGPLEDLLKWMGLMDTPPAGPKDDEEGLACDLLDAEIIRDFGDRLDKRMSAEDMEKLLDEMFEKYGDRMRRFYDPTSTWMQRARDEAEKHPITKYNKEATTGYSDVSVNARNCQLYAETGDRCKRQ